MCTIAAPYRNGHRLWGTLDFIINNLPVLRFSKLMFIVEQESNSSLYAWLHFARDLLQEYSTGRPTHMLTCRLQDIVHIT